MATYTDVLATDITFPHIDVYRRLKDGELSYYVVLTQDGYVMYDTTANDMEPMVDPETGGPVFDPETGEEIFAPVTYYYTIRIYPKTKDFSNFTMVAVPRDSVDENYIFGDNNDNDHEVA